MRILIADDHRLIVEGVKMKLSELGSDTEFLVAMNAGEIDEVISRRPHLDLAMVDLAMPGTRGRRHLDEMLRAFPDTPVMVLSGSEDPALIKELLDLGVVGFVPKAYSPDVMLSAVRLVLSGGIYVPPMMLHQEHEPVQPVVASQPTVDEAALQSQLRELLTERQIDVLRLLSKGKPNKLIARDLNISEGTVKIHLAAIFRALKVRNRVEAVVASRRLGGA